MASPYSTRPWLSAAVFLLLLGATLVLCLWLYWPGLAGPALLDDSANLRVLSSLDESGLYLLDLVERNRAGPLGRPISMLSFGFSQLLGGDLWTLKYHNLLLHCLNGLLAAWLVYLLAAVIQSTMVKSPTVGSWSTLSRPAIASLLVMYLWILSPLLLSSVLYTVQRMAQLATLFTLLALIGYLKLRLQARGSERVLALLLLLLGLVCAPLAKENGVLVVPMLLLLEFGLFRQARQAISVRWLWLIAAGLLVITVIGISYFGLTQYDGRDFTLYQRVINQFGILWYYISQLLLPRIEQMGLYYDDYHIVRSLWPLSQQSVQLIVAAMAWLAVLWTYCFGSRNYRLLVLLLMLYLATQLLESTIIPLEMVFEHRSYPGAVFIYALVVFIALGLIPMHWLWQVCSRIALLCWLVYLPLQTTVLASIWSDGNTHALMAARQHPQSVRAQSELAKLYVRSGNVEAALEQSELMHQLRQEPVGVWQLRNILFACLADASGSRLVGLIEPLSADLTILQDGEFNNNLHDLVKNVQDDRCGEFPRQLFSDRMYSVALTIDSGFMPPKTAASMAIFESAREEYQRALYYAERLIKRAPESPQSYLMALYFAKQMQDSVLVNKYTEQLRQLEQQGQLNREQRDDLKLFLEHSAQENL